MIAEGEKIKRNRKNLQGYIFMGRGNYSRGREELKEREMVAWRIIGRGNGCRWIEE